MVASACGSLAKLVWGGASRGNHWISPWPGSEAALLLGVAHELLRDRRIDLEYVKTWTNFYSQYETWNVFSRVQGDGLTAFGQSATATP